MRYSFNDDEGAEAWRHGDFATREAAIAAGRDEFPGSHFYICECLPCSMAEYLPDADDIMEMAGQRAYDDIGEAASEWPDVPTKHPALLDLDRVLEEWAARHAEAIGPKFWRCGAIERIEPDDDA